MTLLSPGIEIKEKDLSAYISRAATGRAGTVGKFQWGPCFDLTQVTDEADLVAQFGLPDEYTAGSFLSCVNFLKYANDLRVVRVVNPDKAKNASAEFQTEIDIYGSGQGYATGDKVQWVHRSVPWTRDDISSTYAKINFGVASTGSNGPVIAVHNSTDTATIPLTESTPILAISPESSPIHFFTIACNVTSQLSGSVDIYWPADHIATVDTVDVDGAITDFILNWAGINIITTGNRIQENFGAGNYPYMYVKPTGATFIDIGVPHVALVVDDIVRWADPASATRYFRVNSAFDIDDLDTELEIDAAITAGFLVEDVLANVYPDIAAYASTCYFGKDSEADEAILAHSPTMAQINVPTIYARYPGAYGNDIKVDIISYQDFINPLQTLIPAVLQWTNPQTPINRGVFGINGPQNNNQWGIIVYYKGEIVETFVGSTLRGDKDIYGRTIYISDLFAAGVSKYIMAACGEEGYWPQTSMQLVFAGGLDSGTRFVGTPVTPEEIEAVDTQGGWMSGASVGDWLQAWDLFSDPDTLYVNLLFAGGACNENEADSLIIQQYISQSIAEVRRDCLAFLSPSIDVTTRLSAAAAVENAVKYRADLAINSSFAEGDSGQHKFQFDKYNDKKRWVAPNADIAGLCAFTDRVAAPWNSPAGLNRGIIKGVIKLAYDAKKSLRDTLYEAQLNPIVFFPSEGYCLFGDKTLQGKPSAFDRINVRRLFNLLEKAIGDASKYKLFENNTAYTRRSFVTQVSAYLDTIKAQGGVIEYYVWCDERNNTPAVIDRNEFVGTIFVKAPRSINYITLNFVATATGANFEELISSQF
jgi:hypothetical protein